MNPIIIAHRGAKREAPENTLSAFSRAVELGADGIEFDVILTSDGIPVVTHNDDLSVLTAQIGRVHKTPLSVIKKIDAGSHFSKDFAREKIPTLPETLELLTPHDILTVVEIKFVMGAAGQAAKTVGEILSSFRFRGPVMVSSASMLIIRTMAKYYPKIPRARVLPAGFFPFFSELIFGRVSDVRSLHPSFCALTPRLINRARARRQSVYVWTVNEPDLFDRCVSLNVDGIFTDDVAFARRYLGGLSPNGD